MSARPIDHNLVPDKLDSFWMPFSANRDFHEMPHFIVKARGTRYTDSNGHEVLDATAGLWCVNAGHYRPEINAAIAAQLEQTDFAHSFNASHPLVFNYTDRLVKHAPEGMDHVFLTNSGSESVDTALKIALAYHQVRGEGSRIRLVGRQKGYHGMGFGGLTVAGIGKNRTAFGPLLPGADHLPHVLDIERNAFSRGLPPHGMELADELEAIAELHGAHNIAAVVVEPISGAGGVILPPEGYLKRLRELCTKHGILLIFDEVITGFGRTGAFSAAQRFGVTPDIITMAKGISNATIPLGAVFVSNDIYETFMSIDAPGVELFHGYTYSGHPVACAAGMAMLDICESEDLFTRARSLHEFWMDQALRLRGEPNVVDVRCHGLIGAVEFSPRDGQPMARSKDIGKYCYDKGVWTRVIGEAVVQSPPLTITEEEITLLFDTIIDAARNTQ